MGVNAPARCVCFESLRKHDGQEFRFLLPGEYTQMAGRAGRRGKDTVGTVILSCWDNFPTENTLRKLLVGTATKLESQFRLTYAMILNVARAEDLKVEDVLARSFAEFHAQKTVGNRESRLRHSVISLTRAKLISKEASRDLSIGHERWCVLARQNSWKNSANVRTKQSLNREDFGKRSGVPVESCL